MNFKNLKVLCVIKEDRIYTRVVRQDSVGFDSVENWGPMDIKSVNAPELRYVENTLFVRGNYSDSHHKRHTTWSNPQEIADIKSTLQEVNNYYHGNISIQNPNS